MVINDPKVPLAWTAATFAKERYAWFALKDPAVLRGTLLWISNGGRDYAPWSGKNFALGVEPVNGFFDLGRVVTPPQDHPLAGRLGSTFKAGEPRTIQYRLSAAALATEPSESP